METVELKQLTSNQLLSIQDKLCSFDEMIEDQGKETKKNFVSLEGLKLGIKEILDRKDDDAKISFNKKHVEMKELKKGLDKFYSRQKAENLQGYMDIHDLKVADNEMKTDLHALKEKLANIAQRMGLKLFKFPILENEECTPFSYAF